MSIEQFAKFITEQRKERGLTQNDLAKKLNVTDKAVSKWERGHNYPDISTIEALAKVFDVTVLELLNGERKMNQDLKEKDSIDKAVSETLDFTKQMIKNQKRNYLNQGLILIIVFLLVFVGYQGYNQLFGSFGTSVKSLNDQLSTLHEDFDNLQIELDSVKAEVACQNSPITKGIYYTTTGASWRLYSLQFLTCSLIKTVAYDEYGSLDSVRYYTLNQFEPLKFKITGELKFIDTMGTLSYDDLLATWEAKDDLLRALTISEDYKVLDFGSQNDTNKSRRYAIFNQPDPEFWPSRTQPHNN